MASKHKHQTNERFRQNDIRVTNLEGKLERLCAIVDNRIIHSADNIEEQFAKAAQSFEPYSEPVAEPVATTAAFVKVVKSIIGEPVAEPVKSKRNRNTFEKKTMHKDWCARLCAIRAECDISVEILTDHREGKSAACNWRQIERAASLEIETNTIKQGLPNPGTIGAYVKRLHLIVSIAAHKAVMAGDPDAAKIYISRADLLQEIRDEIYIAHPTVTVRDDL